MNTDKKIIKDIPIKGGNTKANVLRVEVNYQLGGWNYFTGVKENRGLYLSVSPLEVGDGFTGYVGFSGVKKHVKEMKRFSKKTLDTFIPDDGVVKSLIDHVVSKNDIILG
jgi:hypothetical protein